MTFQLPELPYGKEDLKPHMSSETLDFHYGKHHLTYVTNLNNLIKESKFEKMTLEEIILSSEGPIFNNAAQFWNHTFFWNSLSPKGGGNPKGEIEKKINDKWESFEKFKEDFTKSALSNFGSGWTWLVVDQNNQLKIINTSNAQTPITTKDIPLLTVDIWEHAYYIDYRNERPKFINAFWSLINWDFANKNLLKKGS
ncbi:MAG: superoxide dismutase [Fe] [Bdellovibrionales bacterium]|nr:superoxide dismutase [Fe] [Bdellovibrionales bacterium]